MSRIFISYRREDTGMGVGRLADALREHFAREQVFQDISSIDPGADFIEALHKVLADCAAVLVVIGPKWLTVADKHGRRRLDNPNDWVRQEIVEALGRPGLKVFPLLVDGAEMPSPDDLPEPLKPLARRQAYELTLRHWAKDVAVLIDNLEGIPALAAKRSSSGASGTNAAAQSGAGAGPIPWKPLAAAAAVVAIIVLWVYSGSAKKPAIEPIAEPAPVPAVTPPPPARAIRPPVEEAAKPPASFRDCEGCPEMVALPGGTFTMGSPPYEQGRSDDEGPPHPVKIAPFALGRTAVTVGAFKQFVAASGYKTEAERNPGQGILFFNGDWEWRKGANWGAPGFSQTDEHPVVGVSWNDARAYVKWIAEKSGKPYRLPSEAEREYATRAKTTTSRFWGDDPDQACRYGNVTDASLKAKYPKLPWTLHGCDDGHVHTAPAGSFDANPFKLYDMLGNVREWTQDCWHDNYKGAPGDGSAWESGDCGRRVVRGGSWYDEPGIARAAFRGRGQPDFRNIVLGFRLARTL